jgi:hypothetical protein
VSTVIENLEWERLDEGVKILYTSTTMHNLPAAPIGEQSANEGREAPEMMQLADSKCLLMASANVGNPRKLECGICQAMSGSFICSLYYVLRGKPSCSALSSNVEMVLNFGKELTSET